MLQPKVFLFDNVERMSFSSEANDNDSAASSIWIKYSSGWYLYKGFYPFQISRFFYIESDNLQNL